MTPPRIFTQNEALSSLSGPLLFNVRRKTEESSDLLQNALPGFSHAELLDFQCIFTRAKVSARLFISRGTLTWGFHLGSALAWHCSSSSNWRLFIVENFWDEPCRRTRGRRRNSYMPTTTRVFTLIHLLFNKNMIIVILSHRAERREVSGNRMEGRMIIPFIEATVVYYFNVIWKNISD